MPELPEVRTVAKVLKKSILNKRVTNIKIIYPKIIEKDSLEMNKLIGKTLLDIATKGKYLIFKFDDLYLVSHLRMEGKYFIKTTSDEIIKHEHIIIEFGDLSLRYHDTRKFGRMFLTYDILKCKGLNNLGPEVFDENLNSDLIFNKIKNKNLPIKEILLDQTIIAGLGNIYANEVLFAAQINPLTKGNKLYLNNIKDIIESSQKILTEAIKKGGTTIKSYTSSLGVTGNYQNYLKVHKKENEKCLRCQKANITKIKISGRSTYYCPNCQK